MLDNVIDLSHQNGLVDYAAVARGGVQGVMHKATQGVGFVDPTYAAAEQAARAAGLRWGAYHYGTAEDPVAQASRFLGAVTDPATTLLALDLERPSEPAAPMTIAAARVFVQHVQAATGRWPGLYSGDYVKEQLGAAGDDVLGRCWLWLAEYGPAAHPPACWSAWTMWQYTDGTIGPEARATPGVGRCDRDRFNGDAAAFAALWPG